MRPTEWVVKFTNGRATVVSAYNEREATILAQADMIRDGFSYIVSSVTVAKRESFRLRTYYQTRET